jgi:hypothetical protein
VSADELPVHLILRAGEIVTLCGLDTRTKAGKPYLLARFVPAHRAGHAEHGRTFRVCAECEHVDRTDNPRRYPNTRRRT